MNWTKILFILLIIAVFVSAAVFYASVLVYLILAIVLAYILDPLVTWLEFKRIPRWLSVLLVYIVIGGVIAWLTARYAPRLIDQGNQFFALLGRSDKSLSVSILELPFIRSMYDFMQGLDNSIPQLGLSAKFVSLIETLLSKLGELPGVLFSNYQTILSTIAVLVTIPVFSFFILKDKQKLRQAIVSLAPNKYFELAIILMNKIDETVGRYLRAVLLEMISVSIMASLALTIVGVPYSVLIGIIAGITNIIPYFGPWIGGVVAVLTILVTGHPPVMIIWVFLAMFFVQALDNYVVYPVVVGKTIKMHPLVVLLTVFAGGWYGGVIWLLISVPLVFMVYSLFKALQINLKQFRLI